MSNTAPTGNDGFDTKEQVDLNMKWLPIYIWGLLLILGFVLAIKVLLQLAGV